MAQPGTTTNILWKPQHPEQTYMWEFMQDMNERHNLKMKTYQDLHAWSIGSQRDLFWEAILLKYPTIFEGSYDRVVDMDARVDSVPKWFEGVKLNWAENILYTASPTSHDTRTKQGKEDDKVAIIEVSESSTSVREFTYGQLRARVALIANAMRVRGVKAGDRVAAIAGNTIDTFCICLAIVTLGGLFSTSSPDLGAGGILERLRQIEPVFVFFDDSYIYGGKQFILKDKIKQVLDGMTGVKGFKGLVSIPRDPKTTISVAGVSKLETLDSFLKNAPSKSTEPEFTRVPFAAGFIIVYSSGTTGAPKCIVHSTGGAVVASWKELHLHRGIGPDSRKQQFTNTSWIMYLASISGLIQGASTVMYDGSPFYPKQSSFIDLAGKYRITHLGVSPRYFSTLQNAGIVPKDIPGLDSLEVCTSTGMVLPVSLMKWYYSPQGFPNTSRLSNISGGTDLAGAFTDGNPIEPVYDVGGCQCIALGTDVRVFDSSIEVEDENHAPRGKEVAEGQPGDLVCVKTFPNMPPYLYADDGSKYKKSYFSRFDNVWTQGDFLYVEPKTKAVILLGRADGVLNPSGIRFGSAEIYTVIEANFKDEIEDTVCVGQRRKGDQDENVILFVKVNPGKQFDKKLVKRIKDAIAANLSKRHVPKFVFETKAIPTTINLKKVELPIKRIVSGEKVKASGTLANPESLEYYYQFVNSEKMAEQMRLVENNRQSKL